jgi:hypothetical protein
MQQNLSIGRLYLDPTGEIGTKNVILHLEPVKKALGFLDLPREIRDYVYEIMFLKEEPLYPSLERAGIAPYLGFLQTNHQVYAEAIDVLYSRNTLQIRAHPAWKSPELLNLIASQKRDNHLFGLQSTLHNNKACQARFSLKKLYIPSHNISLDRLKHLISLLKCFPNLTHLKIIYLASTGIADMEVVNICRMLRDRRPLLKNFVLCKRIAYKEAEDISWMLWEMPYNTWTSVMDEKTWTRVWKNQDGVVRKAEVFNAPQSIPE